MTRSVVATGKDVTEATKKALSELRLSEDQADVKVIDQGRRGFLGLFAAAPARVRVSQRAPTRRRAEEIVATILRLMRFSCQIHVTEEKNALVVDIETAGADGLLIGKGGHTLSAIEYLTNRILQRENRKVTRLILDVSGYKRRREDFLRAKAVSLAKQVKSANKQVTMEPLDAADRRIVHAVLKADPSVETRSVGLGRLKSIIVAPVKGGARRKRR